MKAMPLTFRVITCGVILASLIVAVHPGASAAAPTPKNIIILIGDGMGYNHSLAASYYLYGAAGMLAYEDFPVQYPMSTYSADGWGYDPALAWSGFNYQIANPTDSAAAATAMATGVKTYNAGIGVDVNGDPIGNILETAETLGKSTGVVTSVQFSHATPAAFVAHNISRDDYETIANQMIFDSDADVIMGTGNPWFNNNGQLRGTPNSYKYVGGQATWDALVAGTITSDRDGDGVDEVAVLIEGKAQFQALMSGPTPEFVIGVPQVYSTLQQGRAGDEMADPYEVPLNVNVPTLAEMTLAAINVLDNNPDGFTLMVEGGAIDWAAHANQPGRLIEELVDFNQAAEAVVSWVESYSSWADTLVVVTGDHETGYLWGLGSDPAWQPLVNNGAGTLPGMQFYTTNHTNSLIALYARGEGSQGFAVRPSGVDPVRGSYVDNTRIAQVVFKSFSAYQAFLPFVGR